MKIQLKEITVRELTKDYQDNDEQGVVGFSSWFLYVSENK